MNKSSTKHIEAIIEVGGFEGVLPWKIVSTEFQLIRLWAGTTDVEIGSIMLTACYNYIEDSFRETPSEALKDFLGNENPNFPGGLLFKENDEKKVIPGCCCDLNDWIDWFEAASGNCNIWTGHDPNSLIEINDRKIKIWQDRENKNETFSIEFTVDEMVVKLEGVRKDLQDFLFRLGQWTKYLAPELEKEVVKYFAKNMNINL